MQFVVHFYFASLHYERFNSDFQFSLSGPHNFPALTLLFRSHTPANGGNSEGKNGKQRMKAGGTEGENHRQQYADEQQSGNDAEFAFNRDDRNLVTGLLFWPGNRIFGWAYNETDA